MLNIPLIYYVLRAARRDRLVHTFVILVGVTVSLALFIGDAAVLEKTQFVTVYAAGFLRFLTVGAAVLFTAFYIERAYSQREVEFLLARPIARSVFVVAHLSAFILIALILSALAFTGLAVAAQGHVMSVGGGLWLASLFLEAMLMMWVAFFFGMVLMSSTVSALMAFAFYALARLSGQMLGIVHENAVTWGAGILNPLTKFISILVPRFDMMTQSSWLIYGPQGNDGMVFLLAQAGAFGLLVAAAAVIDLKRRQF